MKRGFSEKEISSLMINIIGQKGKFDHQKISESMILIQTEKIFPEILPSILLDHIRAYKYRAGVLFIGTDHGIYAQQLQFYRDKIVRSLQEKVNSDIQKIEVHAGKLYNKNYKTKDIMSRDEKLSQNTPEGHENIKIIEQLILEVKKIQSRIQSQGSEEDK